MSSVSTAGLSEAFKELSLEWDYTKSTWHDAQSQDFERKYLEELPQHIARAALVVEEINTLLQKIRADCE